MADLHLPESAWGVDDHDNGLGALGNYPGAEGGSAVPMTREPGIAEWVDIVANTLRLSEEYHEDLHFFATKVCDVSQDLMCWSLISTRLGRALTGRLFGTMYQTQQMLQQNHERIDWTEVLNVLEAVKDALAQKLMLSDAQKKEVTAACKEVMVWPGRTTFDILDDVMGYLEENQQSNHLAKVFESTTRMHLRQLFAPGDLQQLSGMVQVVHQPWVRCQCPGLAVLQWLLVLQLQMLYIHGVVPQAAFQGAVVERFPVLLWLSVALQALVLM
ncbi:hypothetical protein NEOLEDRAFT_1147831 [Neolentinus lepideus HHB14362 ss-1]|uniref:Uncharacterized protein n=1 Tax=Neolentinus lepideus HHB14362 ss-1 TaxID=1314782 RepID=A0A165SX35_9AGAM|nr:hypothetical protein NEOLEDRAFT_1147831 [Neolentinus lepideus HHB14362 ss-1]